MQALVDADLVAYRCAASAEGEELSSALFRVDDLMDRILYDTNAQSYQAFLSGHDNFRKKVYPEYKANRTQPRPIYLEACRNHLKDAWQAEVVQGFEADDALGWSQTDETVICTNDKDLRQIPGNHYNFVKMDWSVVDEYQGWFNFYRQFLIGDVADNIKGIHGIGPKKAEKILYSLTPDEMFDTVRDLYNDDKRMYINGRCLYILRKKDEHWNPSKLKQVAESVSISKQTPTSLELTTMQTEAGCLVVGM